MCFLKLIMVKHSILISLVVLFFACAPSENQIQDETTSEVYNFKVDDKKSILTWVLTSKSARADGSMRIVAGEMQAQYDSTLQRPIFVSGHFQSDINNPKVASKNGIMPDSVENPSHIINIDSTFTMSIDQIRLSNEFKDDSITFARLLDLMPDPVFSMAKISNSTTGFSKWVPALIDRESKQFMSIIEMPLEYELEGKPDSTKLFLLEIGLFLEFNTK